MKTIEEKKIYIQNYDNSILKHISTDEAFTNIYTQIKKENFYKKNGTWTYRINYTTKEIEKKIDNLIEKYNIDIFRDGSLKKDFYHGNFCIVGIVEDGKKIIEKYLQNEIQNKQITFDLKRYILGQKDIEKFCINDKILINADNWIAISCNAQGTLIKKSEDNLSLTIKKYNSKKYGYSFKAGDTVLLSKIKQFIKK